MNNQYEKLLNKYHDLEHRYKKQIIISNYYKEQKEIHQKTIKNTKLWLLSEIKRFNNCCGDNWGVIGKALYQEVLSKLNRLTRNKGGE